MTPRSQNEMASGVFSGADLTARIEEITKTVSKKTGFVPKKLISKSVWWDKSVGVGAFHYSGIFAGKAAVLKVQGVKPKTSELEMINAFTAQNKSLIIRAPRIYTSLPWDEDSGYEAYVMENVGNKRIVSIASTAKEVSEFFYLYDEYRKNCINKPWVEKPNKSISSITKENFEKWRKISKKAIPKTKLRKQGDLDLVSEAVKTLEETYKNVDWEFMHGHLSHLDLLRVKDQVVVLSNLYWSWGLPYSDLVFAYHWIMYDVSGVKGITIKKIERQRDMWADQVSLRANKERLLDLVLLERATAGVLIDGLIMGDKRATAEYLMDTTRKKVKELSEKLG